MHEINVTLTPSTVTIQDSDGPTGPAGPAGPAGATGPAGPVTVAPSVTVPASPNVGDVWMSARVADMVVNPSPSGRVAIKVSPGQEPSVWYYGGLYHMVYTHGPQFRYGSATNPMDPASWSFAGSAFLGSGAGGFANGVAHSGVYIEGSTLYLYFVDTTANTVRVATAPITTPTVWTVSGTTLMTAISGGVFGNLFVVKDAGVYRLFVEYLKTDTMPGDGVTNSWQTGMATSSSPTTAFTLAIAAYTTLRPYNGAGAGGSVSGCWLEKEGEIWTIVYHGGSWARSLPNDIYRATSTNLATDSWVMTDQGRPVVRRASDVEIDQVADPFVCRTPGGTALMFWEGYDNRTQASYLTVSAMQPVLRQWDGARWTTIGATGTEASMRPVDGPWQIDNSIIHRGVRKVGTWITTVYSAALGNGFRYNSTGALNNSIEFDVVLAPGTWELRWTVIYDTENGIVEVALDDGSGGWYLGNIATVDLYGSLSANQVWTSPTFTIYGTETIRRSLRFKVTGKNASSSGYFMKDQGWVLIRTDV